MFKSISFQISKHVKICFEFITYNIPEVIIQKLDFINRNCGPENDTFCENEYNLLEIYCL